jgi:uncharacterized protein YbjT (DUF2867 family)
MRILVTGGAGFIGSNFVHYMLKRHPRDQIVVLDKLTYAGNLNNLKTVMKKIEFIKGDICNRKLVERIANRVDVIVNFAAESHVDKSNKHLYPSRHRAGALIESGVHIGPYTSIGNGVKVKRGEIENSIIMDDSLIEVDEKITDNINRVRVGNNFR